MSPHPNLNIPVRVAIGLILLRLVLFIAGADFPFQEEIYLFLLLAAFPALSIYSIWPRKNQATFKGDIMKSLRSTVLFGFIMALFIFIFYSFVDNTYFANMQDMIISRELKANSGVDEEELRRGVENFFSVQNFTVLALLFFVVMGAFYSLLFSALKKLMVR